MSILEYIVISFFVLIISVVSLGILLYPAISSSYYFYYRRYRDGEYVKFKNLIIGMKKSYKQAIPLGLIELAILYIGYVNYKNFGLFGFDNNFLYYVVLGSTLLLTLHSFYTLQLITYFNVKTSKAINLSSYFLMSYIFSTITFIALFAALIFAVLFQPALIVIVMGIFIHISSYIFYSIFKKHSPEETNEDKD